MRALWTPRSRVTSSPRPSHFFSGGRISARPAATSTPADDLPAFHARLTAALAATAAAQAAVTHWRSRRPALPTYSCPAALPAAEAAADARLLEAWHEGAWAALAATHAHATTSLGSGDWDALMGGVEQ